MTYNPARHALSQYQDVGIKASVQGASPHRLIGLLLEGALARINTALANLRRGAIGNKAKDVTVALSIVGGLRGSLDMERGGEVAQNLDDLYDYIQRGLLLANARNDEAGLEEAHALLSQIKRGWDGIDPDAPSATAAHGQPVERASGAINVA